MTRTCGWSLTPTSSFPESSATRRHESLSWTAGLSFSRVHHLLFEVERNVLSNPDIHAKTHHDPKELHSIYLSLLKFIRTFTLSEKDSSEYEKQVAVALTLAPHPEDAPYLAAALSLGCAVWSNDSGMARQEKVRVVTTKELVGLIR